MALPDYYAVLEIPHAATAVEIKQAYRRLVRRYHPDARRQQQSGANEGVNHRLALLNEAYAVLSNPQKRADYDARRRRAEDRRTIDNIVTPPDPRMTWIEGIVGFVRELKKALREES